MQLPGARRGQLEAVDGTHEDGADAPRVRLGDWLRAERLRRGFSLAEVEHDTRINRLYLEALEAEHFDVLPAPVYTRGFLRSYAKRLGLDPEQAIAMLPEKLPTPPGLEPSAAMRRPGKDAPAIALPRLPSMRVPSLRLPELRSPAAMRGLRTPEPSAPRVSAPRAAVPRVRLPALPSGPEAQRWAVAALGAVMLLLAAVFVPRMFERSGDADPTGAQATAVSTQRAAIATAQATAEGRPPEANSGGAAPASGAPGGGGPALGNFVGRPLSEVQKQLQDAGLTWVVVEVSSPTAPAGEVVGQLPTAGTSTQRGDNVTLIVSRGAPKN